MVNGKLMQKTEKEYRAIQRESYSSVAAFLKNRLSYYKKYVLGEKEEDEDDRAILMGHLVESMLPGMEGQFDKKFYLSVCPDAPTGMMLDFVNALYKHTELATVDGEVGVEFKEIAKKAYEDAGYKLKFETVLEKFAGSNAELYYKQLRETRPKGLKIVCQKDLEDAEKIVEELKTNPNTGWYVNLVSDDRYIVLDQIQIEFEIEGVLFKMMADRLIIDKLDQTIQPIDWKITWAVEGFVREYYLKRYAYLQAIVYSIGLSNLGSLDIGVDITNYLILPMKFIVADSGGYQEPLVYQLTPSDLSEAWNGFDYNGRYYIGLDEALHELQWAKENNKFRISRRNHLNKGVCQIRDQRK